MELIWVVPTPLCQSSQCTGSTARATQLAPSPVTLVEPASTQRPPPESWHAFTAPTEASMKDEAFVKLVQVPLAGENAMAG